MSETDLRFTRGPSCAGCDFISKNQRTKSAYCDLKKITFALYEGTREYYCKDFKPLKGTLRKTYRGDYFIEMEN